MFSVQLHVGYEKDIILSGSTSQKYLFGDAFKLEKDGPIFQVFSPCPSWPLVATERDRKKFQCLNIALHNKTEP